MGVELPVGRSLHGAEPKWRLEPISEIDEPGWLALGITSALPVMRPETSMRYFEPSTKEVPSGVLRKIELRERRLTTSRVLRERQPE